MGHFLKELAIQIASTSCRPSAELLQSGSVDLSIERVPNRYSYTLLDSYRRNLSCFDPRNFRRRSHSDQNKSLPAGWELSTLPASSRSRSLIVPKHSLRRHKPRPCMNMMLKEKDRCLNNSRLQKYQSVSRFYRYDSQ